MEKIVDKLLKHRANVVIVFIIAAVLGLFLSTSVSVNYNMIDYLPVKAPSTIAMNTMSDEYSTAVPNLRVMVPDVTIPEALEYKDRIAQVDGIQEITWLDDQVDLAVPLEMMDPDFVDNYYVGEQALFSIVVSEELQRDALEEVRAIIGEEGAMSGNPVDSVNSQNSSQSELNKMMMFIIPMLLLILLFTTTSWMEPVMFMVNVGVAIALNAGTNIFLGEISYITRTTSTILQLACSMDYAIFLLDRFAEYRKEGLSPQGAMTQAVTKSWTSIASSGLTTVVGFLALMMMQFRIGGDMGFVLAKGIVFSLLSTLVFMPCLTIYLYKFIDKTKHRSFMPSFKMFGKVVNKGRGFITAIILILLVPCFLGQQRINFDYGMSRMAAPGSQVANDRQLINDTFGESASFALLVPEGTMASEIALNNDIKAMPEVLSVASYVESIGSNIPSVYVPKEALDLLNSTQYTRFVITAKISPESPETFAFVARLRDMGQKYYPDGYHLAGEAANVTDMKDTISTDTVRVNMASIIGIGLILLLTFKSFSLPFMLLAAIESSIFINLAVPYFTGQHLHFIGYLVISSVQLGATVDYAILFTNRYIENRGLMTKRKALPQTITDTAGSILTSAGILTGAGVVLGITSSNTLIAQIGILIARGAVLSAISVLAFLPTMLSLLEGVIRKTTKGLVFVPNNDKRTGWRVHATSKELPKPEPADEFEVEDYYGDTGESTEEPETQNKEILAPQHGGHV